MFRRSSSGLFSLMALAGLTLFSRPSAAATASLSIANVNSTVTEQITVTTTGGASNWYSATFWCNLVGVSTSSKTFTVGHAGAGTFTYPTYDNNGNTTDPIPEWDSLSAGTYDCYAIAYGGDYSTGQSWQAATTEHYITLH